MVDESDRFNAAGSLIGSAGIYARADPASVHETTRASTARRHVWPSMVVSDCIRCFGSNQSLLECIAFSRVTDNRRGVDMIMSSRSCHRVSCVDRLPQCVTAQQKMGGRLKFAERRERNCDGSDTLMPGDLIWSLWPMIRTVYQRGSTSNVDVGE